MQAWAPVQLLHVCIALAWDAAQPGLLTCLCTAGQGMYEVWLRCSVLALQLPLRGLLAGWEAHTDAP